MYLEPLAIALSRKAKRAVKMVMSREEVFKASGPTSGAVVRVKMGATTDGRFVAGFVELKYQAGAFQGSPVQPGVFCAYAPYDIQNVNVIFVPPLGAIANAMEQVTGIRFTELPMSPPKVLKALKERGLNKA